MTFVTRQMRETVTRDAGQLSIPFVRPERRLPIMIQPIAREGFLGSILPLPCAPSHSFPRFPLLSVSRIRLLEQKQAKSYLYIYIYPRDYPQDYAKVKSKLDFYKH